MTPADIALAGGVLALGAVLQSAVGFGMALVAVPLLVLAGHPLPVAVALLLGAALVQTAHGSYIARAEVRWRRAFAFAAIQWLGLFAGVTCMGLFLAGDPDRVEPLVGLAVLLAVTVQRLVRPVPRDRLAPAWTVIAAGSGGFAAGLVGMGGPPLVLYALAHRWRPDAFRAFLWSQFLLALPVLAGLLAVRFGPHVLGWVAVGSALAPVVWAGSKLGRRLSAHWELDRLQLTATLVLYAIGLAALLGPLID